MGHPAREKEKSYKNALFVICRDNVISSKICTVTITFQLEGFDKNYSKAFVVIKN